MFGVTIVVEPFSNVEEIELKLDHKLTNHYELDPSNFVRLLSVCNDAKSGETSYLSVPHLYNEVEVVS